MFFKNTTNKYTIKDVFAYFTASRLMPFIAVVILFDIYTRNQYMLTWGPVYWAMYALSVIFALLVYSGILRWISRRSTGPRLFFLSLLCIWLGFHLVSAYSFWDYFGIMPSTAVFENAIENPWEVLDSFKVGLTPASTMGLAGLTAALFFFFKPSVSSPLSGNKRLTVVSLVIVLVLSVVFKVHIRREPGAFLPSVNNTFAFARAAIFCFSGSSQDIANATNRMHYFTLAKREQAPPFNVLLLVHESLRALNSSTHGYKRKTCPAQDAYIANHNGVVFSRFLANCSRTVAAIPSMMTGVSTAGALNDLLRAPIISEYAKSFKNMQTFLIASQDYRDGQMGKFLNDGSWDYFISRDMEEFPKGKIGDEYLGPLLDKALKSLPSQEPFFGVVHSFYIHAPYHFADGKDKWGQEETVDRYDASVLTLDANVAKVLKALKDSGRLKNTIIISTSDHAESLGEHGYGGHLRSFYNAEIQVPGWMSFPEPLIDAHPELKAKKMQAQANADKTLANSDILPTILDLWGLWDAKDVSPIRPLLAGTPITRPIAEPRAIWMQNYAQSNKTNIFVGTGVVWKNYKYMLEIIPGRGGKELLFDMDNDPEELNNIFGTTPQALHDEIYTQLFKQKSSKKIFDRTMNN